MNTTRQLKALLSQSYETEGDLIDLLEQCFIEMFKNQSAYAFSLFEEDLQSGKEYNGCLQSLDYYKQQIEQCAQRAKEMKDKKEAQDE